MTKDQAETSVLFELTSAGYERHSGDALNPAGIADEHNGP